ncbi:hypothetical protein GCM10007108_09580 [Thermogymnomonas acidicola]|uniref:DUF1634 domain-containing protein n=1 Tax=Thermogymnomonas acidicola TaxID=399579 RepID=A0AA37F9K0_9ARCH|nr:DUF1634 domain-containing protein [Thermogymnomonas acidicola]GGM73710.1 hypothetical protein GCM10007108_09580 [Thermogymnomonas acidicola]
MVERDTVVSYVLRAGVITSVTLILLGVLLIFARHGADGFSVLQLAAYHNTLDSKYIYLNHILSGIASLDGVYFITLGLWVLIFTPITVVVFSLATFIEQKNSLYIGLAAVVLFDLFFAMIVVPRIIG